MADIIYITASIAFFFICLLFAGVCNTAFHSTEQGIEEDMPKRIK